MVSTTNRIEELDQLIAQFNLNNHPFYQDWRNGTLPVEKLNRYASEYGAFVETIGSGWATLGQTQYVEEEAMHVGLWADFRDELGALKGASNMQTKALVSAASSLFSAKAEATGALYAFEAQQPETATSKVQGLQEHYSVSDKAQEYFKVHARQHSEYGDLQLMLNELSDDEYARAKTACTLMCVAMWSGLDGVYYQD